MGNTSKKHCNDYPKADIEKKFKNKNKQEVYNKYKNQYPLDIENLIKDIGLFIEYKGLPDKISGTFDGDKTITVNKWHIPVRQRFTLAHELGHYLLHEGSKHRQSLVAYDPEEKSKESEANLFARSILMPADEIDKLLKKYQEDIEEKNLNYVKLLIDKFKVSTDALKVRLMTLGYIEGW